MRKIHKIKLLELIEVLQEASQQLEKCKDVQFIDLCAEMQEFVEKIYQYALNVLEEDALLVIHLQKLYEALFFATQGECRVKQLQKLVHKIKIETENLRPNKFEVAFFCYKASMSDSLESVYLAAKKDPQCDAYFIPIPYYDRNPDGSFGKMHFEGVSYYSAQYELTDWRKYNVETRHPDAIFIMNPYDDGNYVTSVHPDFYSKRLKNFTEYLVYIEYGLPYWVFRNPEQVSMEVYTKDGVLHSAYIHSDWVVGYSKEIADSQKQTVKAKKDLIKPFQKPGKRMEDKFVALGSPKFDKVFYAKKEDYELPEEWQQKIAGKKVILLNTSLGEFLKASEIKTREKAGKIVADCKYFEKLRTILNEFYNRDDVVLWWRPHPLFEATINSMRMVLYPEYLAIVQEFQKNNKGILDCTEELHRAIAWSDAMISDESSLLLLYTATGKPFYIPAITKALEEPQLDKGEDFTAPLQSRLKHMRGHRGANVGEWNICIWWDNFLEEDLLENVQYQNFISRFLDFVLHQENYSEAEEYQKLQLQMMQDFVTNGDGTAGQNIYGFVRDKVLGNGE